MLLAAVGVIALTVVHPGSTRQFAWPWILVLHGVWLAPVAASLLRFATGDTWRSPPTIFLAGLLLLAAAVLVSAAASPFSAASWPRVWPTLAGVATVLWLQQWLTDADDASRRLRQLMRVLAGVGAGLAVLSLAGWLIRAGGRWEERNAFPLGHSIQVAGLMLLVLPWILAEAARAAGAGRFAWLATAGAGFVALLGTSSRSAVVAAGFVGVVAAIAFGLAVVRSRRARAAVLLAAAALVVAGVFANPRLRELVLHGGWGDTARASNTQRTAMLEAGWLMGADRPLTGTGPGSVPIAYPQWRHRLSGGVDNVLQLHCTPIQVWATLGFPGAAALLLLAGGAGFRMAAAWRERPREPARLTATTSLLAYGLFALTDHQMDIPIFTALVAVPAAVLMSSTGSVHAPSRRVRAGTVVGCLLLLALPLGASVRDLAARFRYDQALTVLGNGRAESAIAHLESAARLAPYDPYYRHQAAGILLAQRAMASDPAARAALDERATRQLLASLASGTFTEFAHSNLGWLELARGDNAAAARHFRRTLQEAPHRRGAYLGLALALRAEGRQDEATTAFALEWINDPASFTAPLWERSDFALLRPAVEARARDVLGPRAAADPAAAYVLAFWRWWSEGGPAPVTGFSDESTTFLQVLRRMERGEPLPAATDRYAWGRLLHAWLAATPEPQFAALVPRQPGFAAALARRAAAHQPPHWRAFLTEATGTEPALLALERPVRLGYGVLALHPDGPPLVDLYVRQQNRVVSEFASSLFPDRGWIPAGELLARLPAP